jgi:hypothetical protein
VTDYILYVRRDGATWTEAQTYEMLSLEGPPPTENIVAIVDGTDVPPCRELLFYPPNRDGYQE